MRKRWLETIHQLSRQDERVVFIGSDLTADPAMKRFQDEAKGRFFMEGVSEAHIAGMASGLAKSGKIVFVNTIATFITRRSYEQNCIDLGLANANVRLLGSGGGLVYAPLGPTHLAIDDIAIMRAIPNMTIVAPCDANEMARLMPLTAAYQGPMYIRLGKGGDPIVSTDATPFAIGRAIPMVSGDDVLLVSTGITLKIALEAAVGLSADGISAGVLHMPTVKPLDVESFLSHASRVDAIVSIEEHSILGGLGGALAEIVAEAGFEPAKRFKRIGIPDVFPHGYGSQATMMAKYDITPERTMSVARELLASRAARTN
jgi:transketolase